MMANIQHCSAHTPHNENKRTGCGSPKIQKNTSENMLLYHNPEQCWQNKKKTNKQTRIIHWEKSFLPYCAPHVRQQKYGKQNVTNV